MLTTPDVNSIYTDVEINAYVSTMIQSSGLGGYVKHPDDRSGLSYRYCLSGLPDDKIRDGKYAELEEAEETTRWRVAVTPAVSLLPDEIREHTPIDYFFDKRKRPKHPVAEVLQHLLDNNELERLCSDDEDVEDESKQTRLGKLYSLYSAQYDYTILHKVNEELMDILDEAKAIRVETRIDAIQKEDSRRYDVLDEALPLLQKSAHERVKILFPFNVSNVHWLLGEVRLIREGDTYTIHYDAHDPYGAGEGRRLQEALHAIIESRLKEDVLDADITIRHIPKTSPYTPRQYRGEESTGERGDNTSCGVIVAEDLLKRIQGQSLSMTSPYSKGAVELRGRQLTNILTYLAETDPRRQRFIEQACGKKTELHKKIPMPENTFLDSPDFSDASTHGPPTRARAEVITPALYQTHLDAILMRHLSPELDTGDGYNLREGYQLTKSIRQYLTDLKKKPVNYHISYPLYITLFDKGFAKEIAALRDQDWLDKKELNVWALPILFGYHWHALRITLDYRSIKKGKKPPKLDILWDAPCGSSESWSRCEPWIMPSIKDGLTKLADDITIPADLTLTFKSINQQGDVLKDAAAGGVIIWRNSLDYISKHPNQAYTRDPKHRYRISAYPERLAEQRRHRAVISFERDRQDAWRATSKATDTLSLLDIEKPKETELITAYQQLTFKQAFTLFQRLCFEESAELSLKDIRAIQAHRLDWAIEQIPYINYTQLTDYYVTLQTSIENLAKTDIHFIRITAELSRLRGVIGYLLETIHTTPLPNSLADLMALVKLGDKELTEALFSRLNGWMGDEPGKVPPSHLSQAFTEAFESLLAWGGTIDNKILLDAAGQLTQQLSSRLEITSAIADEEIGEGLTLLNAVLDYLRQRDIPINAAFYEKVGKGLLAALKRDSSAHAVFSKEIEGAGFLKKLKVNKLYNASKKRFVRPRQGGHAWHYYLAKRAMHLLDALPSSESLIEKRKRQQAAAESALKAIKAGSKAGLASVGLLAGPASTLVLGGAIAAAVEGGGTELIKPASTLTQMGWKLTLSAPAIMIKALLNAGMLSFEAYERLSTRDVKTYKGTPEAIEEAERQSWRELQALIKDSKYWSTITKYTDHDAMRLVYFLSQACQETQAPGSFIKAVIKPLLQHYYQAHSNKTAKEVREYLVFHCHQLMQSPYRYPLHYHDLIDEKPKQVTVRHLKDHVVKVVGAIHQAQSEQAPKPTLLHQEALIKNWPYRETDASLLKAYSDLNDELAKPAATQNVETFHKLAAICDACDPERKSNPVSSWGLKLYQTLRTELAVITKSSESTLLKENAMPKDPDKKPSAKPSKNKGKAKNTKKGKSKKKQTTKSKADKEYELALLDKKQPFELEKLRIDRDKEALKNRTGGVIALDEGEALAVKDYHKVHLEGSPEEIEKWKKAAEAKRAAAKASKKTDGDETSIAAKALASGGVFSSGKGKAFAGDNYWDESYKSTGKTAEGDDPSKKSVKDSKEEKVSSTSPRSH